MMKIQQKSELQLSEQLALLNQGMITLLSCFSLVSPPVTLTFVGRVGQSEFVSVESSYKIGFLKILKRKQMI